MYDLSTLIVTALFAVIIGAGAGALINRRLSHDGRKQRDLERSVEKLMKQQKDYQAQVEEHFTDTAKLLNNLAESYRDVHNHLASGAQVLCDDDSGEILPRIPDNSITQLAGADNASPVEPPRDYAPKPSPYATGVLNEEFGLEKAPPAAPIEEPLPEPPVEAPLPEPEAASR